MIQYSLNSFYAWYLLINITGAILCKNLLLLFGLLILALGCSFETSAQPNNQESIEAELVATYNYAQVNELPNEVRASFISEHMNERLISNRLIEFATSSCFKNKFI